MDGGWWVDDPRGRDPIATLCVVLVEVGIVSAAVEGRPHLPEGLRGVGIETGDVQHRLFQAPDLAVQGSVTSEAWTELLPEVVHPGGPYTGVERDRVGVKRRVFPDQAEGGLLLHTTGYSEFLWLLGTGGAGVYAAWSVTDGALGVPSLGLVWTGPAEA